MLKPQNNYSFTTLFFVLLMISLSGCAFKRISRSKDITYLEADPALATAQKQLNIFAPRKPAAPKPVFVFIHGGNWNSGKKSIYNYLGSRMARKGVVAVTIDYPLSPQANYNEMATAAAKAVKWVKENIDQYGGNPDKIYVSGHSAGGHLAALISIRNEYFDSLNIQNPIKGAIMIDAAGLDMWGYLKEKKYEEGHTYLKTFTADPDNWKAASPLYHLHPGMPPFLIYRGEETYSSIIKSNEKFVKALDAFTDNPHYHVQEGKKHIPMITQFFWSWNPLYDEIISFMQAEKGTNAAPESSNK